MRGTSLCEVFGEVFMEEVAPAGCSLVTCPECTWAERLAGLLVPQSFSRCLESFSQAKPCISSHPLSC